MLAWASLLVHAVNAQILAPANDILFPSSSSATNPLEFAGANSPWSPGQLHICISQKKLWNAIH